MDKYTLGVYITALNYCFQWLYLATGNFVVIFLCHLPKHNYTIIYIMTNNTYN